MVQTRKLWQDPAMADATTDAATLEVELRELGSTDDYLACVELQQVTWGRGFDGLVPVSVLKVSQKVGGVAAGAFDPAGRMLGFVFGLTGIRPRPGGETLLVHWSHMLAIAPEARDAGLGTRLKRFQRQLLLPLGVEAVEWTFDPLESRNAHMNFNHLGAGVAEYVEEMYAGEAGSQLSEGIGTDRFILSWKIRSRRAEEALGGRPPDATPFREAPEVNPGGDLGDLADAPRVRVEIPAHVQALKADDLPRAMAYRASTRAAFEHYLGRGYRVEAFFSDGGRRFYGLGASGEGDESEDRAPDAP